jgi:hypothetical protein
MDLPPEPESDCCDGHGALEDVDTLVEPAATAREFFRALIVRSIPFSAPVDRLVEASGPSAPTATAFAAGQLVLRFGDGVFDLASSQVAPVPA